MRNSRHLFYVIRGSRCNKKCRNRQDHEERQSPTRARSHGKACIASATQQSQPTAEPQTADFCIADDYSAALESAESSQQSRHLTFLDKNRDSVRRVSAFQSEVSRAKLQDSSSIRRVEVVDYDPQWATWFCRIRDRVWPAVSDFAISIEHVGSTSVLGLAAKPVVDIDLIVRSQAHLPLAISRLPRLGLMHRGTLGIEGRDAFSASTNEAVHHLYVCGKDSLALRNHLLLRDHLRAYPESVAEYSALKRKLAKQFPYDINSYVEGKTEFILAILAQHGLTVDHLNSIGEANRRR